MTENPDESPDPKAAPVESSTSDQSVTPASEPPVSDPATGSSPVEGATVDEGLPEWEPLTPELVEDEAIRGDFVIRWVVVGLALLLGVSQITETRTLVHVKSGEYLIGHGILPAANDVFSHTAQDRRWVNLSWLFDIVMAGVYFASGGIGLSLVQGLITCVAFGLLAHTVRPEIRTWWGSVCAVLALLTCYLQFTVQPELITLLGISFILWTLVKSESQEKSNLLWWIVPAVWLWAQMDPHAWFGGFLLLFWTAGTWLSPASTSNSEKRVLGLVTIASLLVVAIHPFLWQTWLAPYRTYVTDYPAMRAAYARPAVIDQVVYPIWTDFVWKSLNHRTIAALVLFAATIVTMVLNWRRLRWSHVLAFVGFNVLSALAVHELAAASFVNCVICTLNAQTWYREKFGQVYSIDWRELLFSRGGRAVTVVGCFVLAWLILSGRLDGPGGKRTGVGFDNQLAIAMSDYQKANSSLVDDHPFNFSIRQGDLMIWGGQKPFIDSRVALFHGPESTSILSLHKRTRLALQSKRNDVEGTGLPVVWRETFGKYQIRQAWPRLSGPIPAPDYPTFYDLLQSNDFKLTGLNSSMAMFVRTDPSDTVAATYLKDHTFNPVELAFRTNSDDDDDMTREPPKGATTYDNLFSLRRPIVPAGALVGQHNLELALHTAKMTGATSSVRSCAPVYLAIRQANDGLRKDPNSAEAYLVLGGAYAFLGQIESQMIRQDNQPAPIKLRYTQAVAAFHQALVLAPDNARAIQQLLLQYKMARRIDVQLELLRKLRRLRMDAGVSTEEAQQSLARIDEMIQPLEVDVNQIENGITQLLGQGADHLQVATAAYQSGGLLAAIKILEEDAIYLAQNTPAKLALCNWLMEAGRCREAAETIDALEGLARSNSKIAWRNSAATSSLLFANYRRAIQLWEEQTRSETEVNLMPTLLTLPLAWNAPDAYPMSHVVATNQLLQKVRFDEIELQYQIVVAQMELGKVDEAVKSIRHSLELNPASPFRPIFAFYLDCLTGEKIESNSEPVDAEEFSDLAEVAEK